MEIFQETAVALAGMGATVVIGSRKSQKSDEAVAEIKQRAKTDKVKLIPLDLASFASVRAFVQTFKVGKKT